MSSGDRKPWEHAKGGGSEHDELAARFVESLSYDRRLYRHDIAGSIAHARMLRHVGLIDADDLAAIERGLREIEAEIDERGDGWPGWRIELEDVHMCIEAALIEKVGEPGRKLHTGRSRNDQVALDLRMWIEEAEGTLIESLWDLIAAFVELAERQGEIVMPSYTHLQRAQPIVLGGELFAWARSLRIGIDRYGLYDGEQWYCPLGSGAIAGSGLPLDRKHAADGMTEASGRTHHWDPSPNSIEATAGRDKAIDFVYALSMTAMWLSRWAEQWIIYMSSEFGFLTIGDAFTTGSSMMPQKCNPDMLELIRGRCGGVYGHLVALLTICKGLTIGYNRDLQEDKRHVFAAYDTVRDCLGMAARIVRSAQFDERRIRERLERGFLDATSLAEYLVSAGVAFRTAHQHVGLLVKHCTENGLVKLADLNIGRMRELTGCDRFDEDVYDWLGPENVVKRYRTYGNAGLSGFRQQLERWREQLAQWRGDGDDDAEEASADLFGGAASAPADDDRVLIDAYERQGRTLDDLPYTPDFEAIYEAAGAGRSRSEVLHRLLNLRKAGKLPALGRAKERAPIIEPQQADLLRELVERRVGGLSLRDQLPYTEPFDELVCQFNAQTGLSFSPYQVWRVVAKLAK